MPVKHGAILSWSQVVMAMPPSPERAVEFGDNQSIEQAGLVEFPCSEKSSEKSDFLKGFDFLISDFLILCDVTGRELPASRE